jgi:ubiquinone/menaquinone biosynthesis C-methylase UbiE
VELCLEDGTIQSALDVGSGSGIFAEEFNTRSIHVEGVDVNPEMVAACAEILPFIEFKTSAAEDLPYEDNSFDLVFFGMVLHETDNPLKALQEAKRVAAKRVAILEWPYEEQSFGPPLTDRLSKDEIQRLANQAGLIAGTFVRLQNLCLYLYSGK